MTLRPVLSATLALSLGACTSDDLLAAGCRELLSEDMQPGFRYAGVVVVKPFG